MLLRLLTVLPLLSACTSRVTFISTQDNDSALYDVTPTPIRMSSELAALTEEASSFGFTAIVPVGEALAVAFSHSGASIWELQLVNSHMDTHYSDVMILGSRWDVEYALSVIASRGETVHSASSTATGSSSSGPGPAAREAVERVVLDISRQVAALTKTRDPSTTPEE